MYAQEWATPKHQVPAWAQHLGISRWLRVALKRAGHSRERLAERLQVNDKTVDSWLDEGVRPRPGLVASLEAALRDGQPPTESDVPRLESWYSLSVVCDLLSSILGRDTVEMLAKGLQGLIGRALPDIRMFRPDDADQVLHAHQHVLLLGCEAEGARPLLRMMWKEEGNPAWKTDIQAAGLDWARRIAHVAAMKGTPDLDGPVMHDSPLSAAVHRIASDLIAETFEAEFEGDTLVAVRVREDLVRLFREALEVESDNAWLHFQLGSVLDELGLMESAIEECWIAHRLEPDWMLPLDEIAVIYLNAEVMNRKHWGCWKIITTRRFARSGCWSTWLPRRVGSRGATNWPRSLPSAGTRWKPTTTQIART